MLMTSSWPVVDKTRTKPIPKLVQQFDQLKSVVSAARTLAAEEHLVSPTILTTDETLGASSDLVRRLARAAHLVLVKEGTKALHLGTQAPAWVEADDALILARRQRLEAQHAEKATYLKSLDTKLTNDRFTSSAPANVVAGTTAASGRDSRATIKAG